MARSMTGFGRAVRESNGTHASITLRSVNHKGLKLHARVSEPLHAIQAQLESVVRRRLERGAVQLDAYYRGADTATTYAVNQRLLLRYVRELTDAQAAQAQAGLGGSGLPIHLEQVALLPGVVEEQEPVGVEAERLLQEVLPVLEEALDSLVASREREGRALADDIRERRRAVAAHLDAARARIPQALEAYLARAQARITQVVQGLGFEPDPQAVARELALHADRTDVTEEVTRLDAHLVELDRLLESDRPMGLRLEFLAQELLREANTMGSKSADAELTSLVLEMKLEISRLREQVANVE